jgi:hypothetical protein
MNQLYISYRMEQVGFWLLPSVMHFAKYEATQELMVMFCLAEFACVLCRS